MFAPVKKRRTVKQVIAAITAAEKAGASTGTLARLWDEWRSHAKPMNSPVRTPRRVR